MKPRRLIVNLPIGVDLQQEHIQQNILPLVPISTKLEGDNVKQQIMDLYPDLLSGVGTIKNAMVHLDVKPGAIPVVCSPHHVLHAVQPKLKEELDRMLKIESLKSWTSMKPVIGFTLLL